MINKYFQFENSILYNNDCLQVLSQLDEESIDIVVTSPPYDDLRNYKGYSFDFQNIANQLYRILKIGGVIVWVVADSVVDGGETGTSFRQALYFQQIGFKIYDTMIWNKGSFAFPANDRYHQVFEYMFIFSKGKPKTMNFIKDRKNLYVGVRGASGRDKDGNRNLGSSEVRQEYGKRFNIWNYSIGGNHSATDKFAYEHPAIFPQQLVRDHLLTWSNENDIVLDPFAGSGTTLKIANKMNRKSIGIEISKQYCEIITKRLKLPIQQQLF